MSITFTIGTLGSDNVYRSACNDNHRCTVEGCEDHDLYFYCDHMDDAQAACPICSRSVNVSNTNASAILERLGVEFDYCGSIDAADMLGRALVGNIGRDDSGVDSTEDARLGCATMIDCGLRPGYFDDRLGQIADLADYAARHGHLILWS